MGKYCAKMGEHFPTIFPFLFLHIVSTGRNIFKWLYLSKFENPYLIFRHIELDLADAAELLEELCVVFVDRRHDLLDGGAPG